MTAERKELSPDMGSLWEIAMCLVPPTRDRMSPQMRRQIATHFGQIQEAQQQLFQNEFFPETANPARFSDNDEEFAGQLYRQALMMDGRFGKRNVSMLAAMTYDNHTTAEFRESWVNSGQLAATIEFMRRGNINNAVNFLYQFILDRQPDVGGRINYTRRLQNGDNVDDIIREMQRSGEYRQIAIRELYQDLLGREPDAPGLENKLRSGRSVDQIAAEIRGSEEYRRLELTDPDWPKFVLGSLAEHRGLIINDLVKDAFGTPKPNMMTFSRLVREFMAGAAVAETRSLIAGLPNYQRRIAELAARSPEDAVRSMFRLVLGREADPEGLRGYSAVIRRTNNPQAVLAELLHSEEYARMMINQLYHEILARDPDAGGLRDKAAAVRRGVSLGEIAADMRGSEEYRNKSRPPGVSLHLENRATRARLRRGDGIFHYRRDA